MQKKHKERIRIKLIKNINKEKVIKAVRKEGTLYVQRNKYKNYSRFLIRFKS